MRNIVIFVNPANSDDFFAGLENGDGSVAKGVQHTDWANFPHLGILSLASYVSMFGYESVYFDGVAVSIDELYAYVGENSDKILAVCFSAITANFNSCLYIGEFVKSVDGSIKTIFGNDHFSVMHEKIMQRYWSVDYGVVGNEVYQTLKALLDAIRDHGDISCRLPSLVTKDIVSPGEGREEEINHYVDYSLIDGVFDHASVYKKNFQARLTGRIHDLTQRFVTSGVPVEIARGCIKFSGDDACSFCSIQYGGMWRNHLHHEQAWGAIKTAHDNGYDYLYITADELPLTFGRLLLDMDKFKPKWWLDLPIHKRPMLVGYARADGMEKSHVMEAMANIGFKILFVGIDAGAMKSLQALKKPLRKKDVIASSESMYMANLNAMENARRFGVKIKAGFVLGHVGMDKELLYENVREYKNILSMGRDVIVSADVEMLSPEPGSKDYEYLINPEVARREAKALGLEIAEDAVLNEVACYYKDKDAFDREAAINDYIRAMMPTLCKGDIAAVRDEIRAYSKSLGIVVGDEL
ncbi:B12-binding domain-containing radical SAM protein [Billgrantia sp. Q4P2]|uniref:B12-binding domain-containing radical SAM protein n=1 Tax=Billgrantia sp. Q4P2 TaxID=3463857 RepID=UPI004055CE75